MRSLAVVFAFVGAAPRLLAQQPAPPTRVVIQVTQRVTVVLRITGEMAPHDSSSLMEAIRRGIQVDSLVEIVERPPKPGDAIRPARYMVTTATNQVGSMHMSSLRVIDMETGTMVLRESTRAVPDALPDSLAEMGRRVARSLAGTATPIRIRRP
jgi:hypothetical protein